MAHRPLNQKASRRAIKLVRRRSLPGYIDLVQWLLDRGYAQTKGAARKILTDERVRVDSHPVGFERQPTVTKRGSNDEAVVMVTVAQPFVPAESRGRIVVIDG